MKYGLTMEPAARRKYKSLAKKVHKKIRDEIDRTIKLLQENPYSDELDIKKLSGYRDGRMRARPAAPANDYRVLYRVVKNEVIVEVIDIDHRRDVYN